MNMDMNMNKKNKKRKWNHKDNNNNSSGNDDDDDDDIGGGSIIISSSSLSSNKHNNNNNNNNNNNSNNNTSNNNTILQDIINPNFNHLASIYPEFAKQWIKLKQRRRRKQLQSKQSQYNNNNDNQQQQQQNKSNNQHNNSFSSNVDFEFNKSLSSAILKHYFQLSLPSIPNGYLCPPIPNRLNYILWIQNELLYQVYNCNNNNDDDENDDDYFIWWNDNSSNDDSVYNDVKKNGDNKNDNNNNIIRKCKYQGIDIGIGASCIYPLLLCTKYFDNDEPKTTTTTTTSTSSSSSQWKILGTDIDPISIQCAQENINANNLQDRIKITLVPPTMDQKKSLAIFNDGNGIDQGGNDDNGGNDQGSLKEEEYMTPIHAAMMAAKTISLNSSTSTTRRSSSSTTIEIASQSNNNESHEHSFDFVMTNPPFYSQVDEATKPRIGDGRKRIDMTMFESVYPGQPIGGEVKFVVDMIHDSLKYRHDIIWFTAMLGKKSSYIPIEKELEKAGLGIGSIRKTEFVQGKTRRWGIGWTFLKPSLRSKGMKLSLFLDLLF